VKRFRSPAGLPTPVGYSHVVEASGGRVIYVSGQLPVSGDGELVGEDDFEAQVRQVFENLGRALEAVDASWDDIVKLNYFVRDVRQVAAVRSIRDAYVNTEQPPASTLVEVSALAREGALIEVDAVAIAD
jgi:enamine deaminase RidA (YjgF/YER057c/UK114 family)